MIGVAWCGPEGPVSRLQSRIGMQPTTDRGPRTFNIRDAEACLRGVRCHFVNTMPQWPHAYIVRQWRPDPESEFEAFVHVLALGGRWL